MQFIRKEWNDWSGCFETYYWDDVAQKVIVKNTYNVTAVLENNKRLKHETIDQRFGNNPLHLMAEIPNAFIVKFKQEHNLDVFSKDPTDQMRLRRLLESPEYSFLKTNTKKLWRPVSKGNKDGKGTHSSEERKVD